MKATKKATKAATRYVVVATDKRGVFSGLLESYDTKGAHAVLLEGRQVVHWSAPTGGFLGLAGRGPQKGSRVSPPAPRVELPGVHCVADCSAEARAALESGLWD